MPHTLSKQGNPQETTSCACLHRWLQGKEDRGVSFYLGEQFFPKNSVLVRDSSCWSLMELRDLPKEAQLRTTILFIYHHLSSCYRLVGKGIQFFWKRMAGFIFLYMNPHSIASCLYMVLSTEAVILPKAPGCTFTSGTNKNSDCIRYPFIKPRCHLRMLCLTVPL